MSSLPASVAALDAQYPYEAAHRRQVARLALRLFDALEEAHGYGEGERLLLHCAARLHDIGVGANEAAHHKAAQRMILDTELPPFSDRERTLIALIARYHRKALPAEKHALYAELKPADRRRVCWLAGILRVADGLDRTHAGVVHDVRCVLTADAARIIAVADEPAEAERYYGQAKGDLLALMLERPLAVEVAAR